MVRVRVVDGLIAEVAATAESAPGLARALELALPGTHVLPPWTPRFIAKLLTSVERASAHQDVRTGPTGSTWR